MDEIWLRLGVVVGALTVAGGIAAWQRIKVEKRPARDVRATGLDAGIYLLTSSSCPTCRSARGRLTEAVGPTGFKEMSWEQDPGVFAELGVDAVPAVLVVEANGAGRLHPGAPDRAIAAL